MFDAQIAAALGSESRGSLPVGHLLTLECRGDIHSYRRLRLIDGRSVCVKYAATVESSRMLQEEAVGLARLSRHVSVPKILAQGEGDDGRAWLAMEWLPLLKMDAAWWIDLGRQLVVLHSVTRQRYGLSRNNFNGGIPQDNTPADDWREFYIERRLRPQIRLAQMSGHDQPEAEIVAAAERLLEGHPPRPTLLHGNLSYWNVGPIAGGKVVFFNPAPYFGDPECDLARLGWQNPYHREAFLIGYGEVPRGYSKRLPLYEVHDALVRLNSYRGEHPEWYARRLKNSVRELLGLPSPWDRYL
jgi:protein-ribulosamine 3-kinase